MPVMLTGRLAQGLGDGGLVALSLVSVIRLLPSTLVPRETARIVGTGIFAKCAARRNRPCGLPRFCS